MPLSIAWKTEAMPCTMPIRQAPMDWKTDLIWRIGGGERLVGGDFAQGEGGGDGVVGEDGGERRLTQDTTAPIFALGLWF